MSSVIEEQGAVEEQGPVEEHGTGTGRRISLALLILAFGGFVNVVWIAVVVWLFLDLVGI